MSLYERALSLAAPGLPTPAERARALLARGPVQLNTGELDDAEHTADMAHTLAIEASLGRETGKASALLGILANLRGRWKDQFRAEFITRLDLDPRIAGYIFDAHLCLAESCLHGPPRPGRIAPGRWKEPAAWVICWPSNCSPAANELSTCNPNWPRGCGC